MRYRGSEEGMRSCCAFLASEYLRGHLPFDNALYVSTVVTISAPTKTSLSKLLSVLKFSKH